MPTIQIYIFVPEMTGYGTQCHSLLDTVVINQRLDSAASEVF